MTRGDVHALHRIEKHTRQQDRSGRKLSATLAKTSRNKRRVSLEVHAPPSAELSFAKRARLPPTQALARARRRLTRKAEGERRPFAVGELASGFERVDALVLVPMQPAATLERLAEVVTKEPGARARFSASRVMLLTAGEEVETGASSGDAIYARIASIEGGPTLFLCAAEPPGPSAPPRALGLDRSAYLRLQREVASLIGARLL